VFLFYFYSTHNSPLFRPEIQAQCTLINFIATESGLQDQLLARVVNEVRPLITLAISRRPTTILLSLQEKAELERRKQELAEAFNRYKMQLLQLEDDLLTRLANAPDDILSDVPLIEGLEATKAYVHLRLSYDGSHYSVIHTAVLLSRLMRPSRRA
jgi:dynein heavy chain